jgi:hypothetical protein
MSAINYKVFHVPKPGDFGAGRENTLYILQQCSKLASVRCFDYRTLSSNPFGLQITGAGYENQTRTSCLGSKRTITILIPQKRNFALGRLHISHYTIPARRFFKQQQVAWFKKAANPCVEPPARIELATYALRVRRSTN